MNGRELALVAAMGLGVYLPKVVPLLLVSGHLSPGLRRWLGYVAPAVLSALVAPAVLAPAGRVIVPGWEQAGYLAAFLVALATRRMLPSLAAGLSLVLVVALLRR